VADKEGLTTIQKNDHGFLDTSDFISEELICLFWVIRGRTVFVLSVDSAQICVRQFETV